MGQSVLNKYRLVPVNSTLSHRSSMSAGEQANPVDKQTTSLSLPAIEGTEIMAANPDGMKDQYVSVRSNEEFVEMEREAEARGVSGDVGQLPFGLSRSVQRERAPLLSERLEEEAQQEEVVERHSTRSITANIISTLLLRIASRISFVLLGFYLGEHFGSATAVALVLESFYISELALAPVIGSLSDRLGRKPFLVLAPVLGAVAALCLLAASQFYPHPDGKHVDVHLLILLGLVMLGRLLEGATTALNTPASLGYITDVTTGSEKLRTRVMTAFEVATVGGLALAIPLGGQVSARLGT